MCDDSNSIKEKMKNKVIDLIKNMPEEIISPDIQVLYVTLLNSKSESDFLTTCLSQTNSLSLISSVLDSLSKSINIHKSTFNFENFPIISSIFSYINQRFPASFSTVNETIISFYRSAAALSLFFPEQYLPFTKQLPTNPNQIALLFFIGELISNNSEILHDLQKSFPPKLVLSPMSFGLISLIAKHPEIDHIPSIKSILQFYKSLTDPYLFSFFTPSILSILMSKSLSSHVKELASLIPLILPRLSDYPENIPTLYSFIDFIGTSARPFLDDILRFYLDSVVSSEGLVRADVGDAFYRFTERFELNPLNNLVNFETHPSASLLGTYIIEQYPESALQSNADSVISHFDCTPVLAFFAHNGSKEAVHKLVLALIESKEPSSSSNINQISREKSVDSTSELKNPENVLISNINKFDIASILKKGVVPFDILFPELVAGLKPQSASESYINILAFLLKQNLPHLPQQIPNIEGDMSVYSDSNCELAPDFAQIFTQPGDSDLHYSATANTTLFCTVISNVDKYPSLMPLLLLSASTISPKFSELLGEKMQTIKGGKLKVLAAYSNALLCLDLDTLYSLAKTFSMLLPGNALLYLAVSLVRLPQSVMTDTLQAAKAYAPQYPDTFAKAVALVAHSHPEIAQNFLDNYLKEHTKSFLWFRPSDSLNAISVTFRTIGYCSIFVDDNFFINTFLPFATQFMNSRLPDDIDENALFAIRKLCSRVLNWQETHSDHLFPFKDFILQCIVSHFPETPIPGHALNTLNILFSVRPLRLAKPLDAVVSRCPNLFFDPNLQNTGIQEIIRVFLKAYLTTSPTFSTILLILNPFLANILEKPQWKEILALLTPILKDNNQLKLQTITTLPENITSLMNLILNLLPLGEPAEPLVKQLMKLFVKIRAQFLSINSSQTPESDQDNLILFCLSHMLGLQVFDEIILFLNFLASDKILPEHQGNAAHVVRVLFEKCGMEDFRYDLKIVQNIASILDKTPKEDSIRIELLAIITKIAELRLFSLLSVMTNVQCSKEILDEMFSTVMKVNTVLPVLSDSIAKLTKSEDVEDSTLDFIIQILPRLSSLLPSADNDSWATFFVISPPESPAFKALFGNIEENLMGYARLSATEHPLALPLIIDKLPETLSDFHQQFLFAIAIVSPEMRNACIDKLGNSISNISNDLLLSFMKEVPSDEYSEILLPYLMPRFPENYEVIVFYIQEATRESSTMLWREIIKKQNLEIIVKLMKEVYFSPELFIPLIPDLCIYDFEHPSKKQNRKPIVNSFEFEDGRILDVPDENTKEELINEDDLNQKPEKIILSLIEKKLNIYDAKEVMLHMFLSDSNHSFISRFVELGKNDHFEAALFFLEPLCVSIDDSTSPAINFLIDKLDDDNSQVTDILINLISDS